MTSIVIYSRKQPAGHIQNISWPRVGLAATLMLLVAVSSRSDAAGSASANLSVSASVANNCTISTSPLAFGAYDPVVAYAWRARRILSGESGAAPA